jgi:hypothetical protein
MITTEINAAINPFNCGRAEFGHSEAPQPFTQFDLSLCFLGTDLLGVSRLTFFEDWPGIAPAINT